MPPSLQFSVSVRCPPEVDAHTLARFGARAEALGFQSLLAGDHLYSAGTHPHCISVLAVLAAATERVALGFCAYVLPLRAPLFAAKELAELDRLSRGRLLASFAAGSSAAEFATFGIPFEERGARLDEGLAAVTQLWTGEPVSFEGRFYRFAGAKLEPPPLQRPHPPIWIASWSGNRRSAERIARSAAGWQASGLATTVAEFRAGRERIERAARALGRDPATIGRSYVNTVTWLDADRERAWQTVESGKAGVGRTFRRDVDLRLVGTPDDAIARLTELAEAGVKEVAIQLSAAKPEQLELFAREVGPAFATS